SGRRPWKAAASSLGGGTAARSSAAFRKALICRSHRRESRGCEAFSLLCPPGSWALLSRVEAVPRLTKAALDHSELSGCRPFAPPDVRVPARVGLRGRGGLPSLCSHAGDARRLAGAVARRVVAP